MKISSIDTRLYYVPLPTVLAMLRDDLASMLVGTDPRCIERLWEQMWWRLHYVGRGGIASFAISASLLSFVFA